MTELNVFTQRLRTAHYYMKQVGHTKGTEKNQAGEVCLTGAVRYCSPQNGDEEIIRQVLSHRNRAESWNDYEATEREVFEFLRTEEITDDDLEMVFGPHWEEVVALVREAASLTEDQVQRIRAASNPNMADRLGAARRLSVVEEAYFSGWAADAAYDAADNSSLGWKHGFCARVADAARAVAARNFLSEEDFNALYGPWAARNGDRT